MIYSLKSLRITKLVTGISAYRNKRLLNTFIFHEAVFFILKNQMWLIMIILKIKKKKKIPKRRPNLWALVADGSVREKVLLGSVLLALFM